MSVIRWSPGIICTVVPTSKMGGVVKKASFMNEQTHQSAVKIEQLCRAW